LARSIICPCDLRSEDDDGNRAEFNIPVQDYRARRRD
jgi:hypothetical protein